VIRVEGGRPRASMSGLFSLRERWRVEGVEGGGSGGLCGGYGASVSPAWASDKV
jgi:hypothetical protein